MDGDAIMETLGSPRQGVFINYHDHR